MSFSTSVKKPTKQSYIYQATIVAIPNQSLAINTLANKHSSVKIKKVYLSFPPATYYELEVYFTIGNSALTGIIKRIPENDSLLGDNESYEIPVNESVNPLTGFWINVKNNSTTNTHTVNVIVYGEE